MSERVWVMDHPAQQLHRLDKVLVQVYQYSRPPTHTPTVCLLLLIKSTRWTAVLLLEVVVRRGLLAHTVFNRKETRVCNPKGQK